MLTMPDGYIDACAGRNFHTITSLSSRVVHGVGRIPQMKISPLFTALSTHLKKFILLCSVQIDFFSCCPSREIESGKLNLRKKLGNPAVSQTFWEYKYFNNNIGWTCFENDYQIANHKNKFIAIYCVDLKTKIFWHEKNEISGPGSERTTGRLWSAGRRQGTNIKTNKQTNKQKNKRTNKQTNKQTNKSLPVWISRSPLFTRQFDANLCFCLRFCH